MHSIPIAEHVQSVLAVITSTKSMQFFVLTVIKVEKGTGLKYVAETGPGIPGSLWTMEEEHRRIFAQKKGAVVPEKKKRL